MPKTDVSNIVYRCTAPFAKARVGGQPEEVYNLNSEVFGDHPILKTHRGHFEPVVDGVLRREAMPTSFGPGGFIPARSATPNNESENINA